MAWEIIKRLWRFLIRMDIVSILFLVLLALTALGSCFPQYPLYSSPIFIIVFSTLVISTLICLLDRWRGIWRQVFHQEIRPPGRTFDLSSHTARLNLSTNIPTSLVGEIIHKHGFRIKAAQDEDISYIRGDRNRYAPLGRLLSHLGMVLLMVSVLISSLTSWREEIDIAGNQATTVQHSPGMTVSLEDFRIERYPDGSAASYLADTRMTQDPHGATSAQLQVNHPATYRDMAIYLAGFSMTNEGTIVRLLMVHDPGYGFFVAAGLLLLLGMIVSFNFPPSCIFARIDAGGMLCLAGRADQRAYHSERTFNNLVKELEGFSEVAFEAGDGQC